MIGCEGGHWVMGTPYSANATATATNGVSLTPTIVFGIYSANVYSVIAPVKALIGETIPTPADCAALVHRDYPSATAAEYSNDGKEVCSAVFDA